MVRLAPLALGAVTVALLAGVALELRPSRKAAEPPTVAKADPAPSGPTGPALVQRSGRAWVEIALARPLFATSRRPVATAQAAQAQPARGKLPRLAGIMMDGNRRSVIFAPAGDRKPIIVAEGGEFDGYRVEHIEAGLVTVSGLGTHQVLRPSFDPAAPVPSPPPVAAASLNPALPVIPASGPAQGYNGPPGLDRMPALVGSPGQPASPGPITPGLPGLPSLESLTGVPGISVPGPAPLP